jgi:hypothetical protein
MAKTIGRITLFHVKKDGKLNQPDYRGEMITAKGKYTISLWSEPNGKVTNGEILKGQVVDNSED